ncbi:MAG: SulP family inorganic anion transporter [Hydrogenimonas sp.]|nr:MAG: SulP family inorganic anion transporter [Hydrogenimonas sp.]
MFAQLLRAYSGQSIKNDVLSGAVVAIALVPEAIAFSLIAGVSPLVGLYTAFLLGLITALFGGKPGMISGATGSVAVVMVSLVATHGVEYLFLATVLTGLLQVAFGLMKLAKFIRLVPQPAILGFVNGLAIIIALAQLPMFEGEGPVMYALVFATMATMVILPKITKAVPAGLVAIIVLSLITIFFDLDTKRVADLGSIAGDLPSFHLPDVPLNLETFKIILPYAVVMAAVGLIESLLTLSVLDEMSGEKGNANKEAMALGAGNATCGLFGGMAGCAMIGQSIINFTSGGRGRLSGVTAAILLILFVVSLSDYIGQIPIAVLVGIMFMVSIETFEWASIDRLRRMPKADAFILVTVTIVTIFTDLAMAVVIGVIISALVFAWQHARVYTRTYIEGKRKIYEFDGPLFFGSVQGFLDQFDVTNDPDEVVMDFKRTRVMDSSGVEAIDKITKRYEEAGKKLTIRHLSDDCKKLLKAAGKYCTYEEDDPTYKVAVNHEEYQKVY